MGGPGYIQDNVGETLTHVTMMSIAALNANFQHFTWVSILLFLLMNMLRVVQIDHLVFWWYVTIQVAVIAGVVVMAYKDCGVFEDAYLSYGEFMYIVGQYGMHFIESNIQYARATRRHLFPGVHSVVQQVTLGLGTCMIWYHFEDPVQVYRCSMPSLIGVTGFVASSVGAFLIGWGSQPIKH
jgi:hypothetical protein